MHPAVTATMMITTRTTKMMMAMVHWSRREHFYSIYTCTGKVEKRVHDELGLMNWTIGSSPSLSLSLSHSLTHSLTHSLLTLYMTPFSSCRFPSSTLMVTCSTFCSIVSTMQREMYNITTSHNNHCNMHVVWSLIFLTNYFSLCDNKLPYVQHDLIQLPNITLHTTIYC